MSDQVAEMGLAYSASVADSAVPEGYKQTEVGVIPDDWKVLSVGAAFEVCNFLRFPISSKIRERMAGEYPYYGPTKIQDYINEFRVDGEFALIGEDGDHFLKFDSTSQTQYVKGKFNVNNHAHLVKGRVAEAIWFFYFYRNKDISIHLTRQGAGRYKLNKASLEKILCAIPHKNEQTAIANALSDVDALISEQEKLIAKKQAIKTATMQQLLTGRTRLPQFALREDGSPKGYKQSELGEVPEDWALTTIGQNTSWMSGGTPSRSNGEFWSGNIPWISGSTLKSFEISTSDQFLNEEGVASGSKMAPLGAVLLLVRGSALHNEIRAGVVVAPVAFNQDVKALVPSSNLNSKYLTLFIRAMAGEMLKLVSSAGNSAGVLDTELVKNFWMTLPSEEEQSAITDFLTDTDEEILALQHRLAKTRQIKQGMMQELLTGKTRLVKPTEKECANV